METRPDKQEKIEIALDKETGAILNSMAEEKNTTASVLASLLFNKFVEEMEDAQLVALCDMRMADGEGFITHEELLSSLDEDLSSRI